MMSMVAIAQTENPDNFNIDTTHTKSNDSDISESPYSEWFKGGNIDFISSGLLRSTANIFILKISRDKNIDICLILNYIMKIFIY